MKKWFVYILECADGSYYTGVTTDVDKRMKAHAEGKGSKYVYRKGFRELIAAVECKSKSDACKKEYEIKNLPRGENAGDLIKRFFNNIFFWKRWEKKNLIIIFLLTILRI